MIVNKLAPFVVCHCTPFQTIFLPFLLSYFIFIFFLQRNQPRGVGTLLQVQSQQIAQGFFNVDDIVDTKNSNLCRWVYF